MTDTDKSFSVSKFFFVFVFFYTSFYTDEYENGVATICIRNDYG